MKDLDMRMKKTPSGFSNLNNDEVYEQHIKDKLKSEYNEIPYTSDCGYVYSFTKGTASILTVTNLVSELKSIFSKSELIVVKDFVIRLNRIRGSYDIEFKYIPKKVQSIEDNTVKQFNFKLV
jgi:hypothetical protein